MATPGSNPFGNAPVAIKYANMATKSRKNGEFSNTNPHMFLGARPR